MGWLKRKTKAPRTSDYLPGDLVNMHIQDDYFAEYRNRHGVVIYGPDNDGGWIVNSAPGSIRCTADELTMIAAREDRTW
jgi:hypothetical protein